MHTGFGFVDYPYANYFIIELSAFYCKRQMTVLLISEKNQTILML